MPRITLSGRPAVQATTDLLVLPVVAAEDGPVAPPSTRAVLEHAGMELAALAGIGHLTGALDETLLVPAYGRLATPALLLVGIGPDAGRTPETLRRAASVAAGAAGLARTVATSLPQCAAEASAGSPASAAQVLAAVAEGFGLAAYRFDRYKSGSGPALEEVLLLTEQAPEAGEGLRAALRRARTAVDATRYTRDLVNEPAGTLGPAELATEAARLAASGGLEIQTIEGQALARGGFGAAAAVGAGSAVPPRLVVLRHQPPEARLGVSLVGKGVTFDTGGLCLKRGKAMDGMKDDMAGAATVLGVLGALPALGLPVAVTGVLPLVENMPGAAAMRPGDVIRARNGTSIEITDTDAEGRLALADGLALAAESRPDAILDVATLTGSAVAGLGPACTAVLSNSPSLAAAVLEAAAATGEPAAQLPLVDDYRRFLDSDVADLRNASDQPGDAIQAALFLREFVAGLPWAHLDIAGPATAAEARYYQPKGATGCMVRTLLELLERMAGAATASVRQQERP
jgi:leucyl aminopeptidase